MLRSFRLANHGSIRAEQELLLLPVYDGGREPLTVSAIYGANAAGKSTLLNGLAFMQEAVRDSYARWPPGGGVPRHPFRLDRTARDQPSHFVVDLDLAGVRHTYGFSLDDDRIIEEWLYSYPERKRRIIFERSGDAVKFGSTVGVDRGRAKILDELTRPDALFLSMAVRANFRELLPIYGWFVERLRTRVLRISHVYLIDLAARVISWVGDSSQRRGTILGLLKFADIGISDIRIIPAAGERFAEDLHFIHNNSDDPFSILDESAGTWAWLDILLDVLMTLADGATLLVDEIDTSLHPRLTARLISLFQNPETNTGDAQLICTTHDTTLLSPILGEDALARDQVWFTEKNQAGETNLYPLSDFRPRKGENVERRYLGGSYGAVPKLFPEDLVAAMRESGVKDADGSA